MTRVAKHSCQTFNIKRRNDHKGIFLVIFGGVLMYVTLPLSYIDLQQVGFLIIAYLFTFFFLSFFVYSCPTSFGQKYDLFSHLGKQMDIFLGTLYTLESYLFGLIQYLSA